MAKIPDYKIIEYIQHDIGNPELDRILSAKDTLKRKSDSVAKEPEKKKKRRK